jgi:hypothetical protein
MPEPRFRHSRRLCAIIAGGAIVALLGCDGVKSGRLIDYLDELEFDVPLETATYVSLGRFDIPIATSKDSTRESKFVQQIDDRGMVWMRLQFELTAETTPQQEQAVLEAAQKHRGMLNDAVLTIVRTSTIDELSDPRLAAVHARISEVARPLLGESLVRQLVFNDPQSVAEREKREAEEQAKAHGGGHGGGHGEAHGDSHGSDHGDGHGDEHGGDHGEHGDSHGEEAHGHGGDHGDAHGEAEHGSEGHGDDHGQH